MKVQLPSVILVGKHTISHFASLFVNTFFSSILTQLQEISSIRINATAVDGLGENVLSADGVGLSDASSIVLPRLGTHAWNFAARTNSPYEHPGLWISYWNFEWT
jgi:hypothetical protein